MHGRLDFRIERALIYYLAYKVSDDIIDMYSNQLPW